MHKTGKYKFTNLTFGILPFIAMMLIVTMHENSSPARLWLSIVRTINSPELVGRILIPCRFLWDSETPSSCKPCSVSRFADIVDHDYDFFSQVALLAHIPRESADFTFLDNRELTTCPSFPESAMAVGTGFGQLFRSFGQVRSIVSVVEPVQNTTWCRSSAWPSPRQFSSRFSIVNFGTGSAGPDQMRYYQN